MVGIRDRRYIGLALAALIFARTIGGSLPYFLLYVSVGLVLAAYLWTRAAAANLTCTYSVGRRCLTAGEPLDVRLRLYNEGWLPILWLEATDELLAAERHPAARQVFCLGPLGSVIRDYTLPSLRRGHYRLGPMVARVADPLGMFDGRRRIFSDVRVLVYPRLVPLEGVRLPSRQPFGKERTRLRACEDPSSLAEVRPYRPGDHAKLVHWRTTARRGLLHVKEYELNASCDLSILLDLHPQPYDCAGKHCAAMEDAAVEAALALCHYALRRDYSATLITYQDDHRMQLPLGRGLRRFGHVLETMARLTPTAGLSAAELAASETRLLPPRSTVVLITPDLSAQLVQVLLRLQGRRLGVALATLDRPGFAAAAQLGLGRREPAREAPLAGLRRAGVIVFDIEAGGDLRSAFGGEQHGQRTRA